MLKNICYAVLLGVGMAACLSQNSNEDTTETGQVPAQITDVTDPEAVHAPSPENFVIQENKVGTVAIGMPIDSVRNNVVSGFAIADTTLQLEGQAYTAYNLHVEGDAKGMLIEQQCDKGCKVWRINVKSPDYKTGKGIGVGSKYSEIQQLYPIETVVLADGGLVAVSDNTGMSFVLDTSQIPANERGRLTPATVPANTLVKSILVY